MTSHRSSLRFHVSAKITEKIVLTTQQQETLTKMTTTQSPGAWSCNGTVLPRAYVMGEQRQPSISDNTINMWLWLCLWGGVPGCAGTGLALDDRPVVRVHHNASPELPQDHTRITLSVQVGYVPMAHWYVSTFVLKQNHVASASYGCSRVWCRVYYCLAGVVRYRFCFNGNSWPGGRFLSFKHRWLCSPRPCRSYVFLSGSTDFVCKLCVLP